MGRDYFTLKIEAEITEQQLPRVATDLAVIIGRDMPLNPIREVIEALEKVLGTRFKTEKSILQKHNVSIVIGPIESPRLVIFSWEKSDVGYLFTVTEPVLPEIRIDKKTVKQDLKYAIHLIHAYFKKQSINSEDIHIQLSP